MIKDGAICVVCAENKNGIGEHVYQLITKANELHNCGGGEVVAICVGINKEVYNELFQYGVDKIIVCCEQPYNRYEFAEVVVRMISSCRSELIMFPASDWGETCAAEVAIKLGAGLTANCMNISIEEGEYVFTRAALNCSILAKISANNSNTSICTVQRNAFRKERLTEFEKKKVFFFKDIGYTSISDRVQMIQRKVVENHSKINNLDCARIVFGFGRGLVDKNDLQLFKRVAEKYHAEIVGTRAVYEQGFITKNRQVGQSGISIAPIVYVAFGISGASQHMVGVMNAKQIISVNTDINAPINEFANHVIIEDCSSVLRKMDKIKL